MYIGPALCLVASFPLQRTRHCITSGWDRTINLASIRFQQWTIFSLDVLLSSITTVFLGFQRSPLLTFHCQRWQYPPVILHYRLCFSTDLDRHRYEDSRSQPISFVRASSLNRNNYPMESFESATNSWSTFRFYGRVNDRLFRFPSSNELLQQEMFRFTDTDSATLIRHFFRAIASVESGRWCHFWSWTSHWQMVDDLRFYQVFSSSSSVPLPAVWIAFEINYHSLASFWRASLNRRCFNSLFSRVSMRNGQKWCLREPQNMHYSF